MGGGHGRGAFAPLKHDLKPLALQAGASMRAVTVGPSRLFMSLYTDRHNARPARVGLPDIRLTYARNAISPICGGCKEPLGSGPVPYTEVISVPGSHRRARSATVATGLSEWVLVFVLLCWAPAAVTNRF